jgi:hypothetical protein
MKIWTVTEVTVPEPGETPQIMPWFYSYTQFCNARPAIIENWDEYVAMCATKSPEGYNNFSIEFREVNGSQYITSGYAVSPKGEKRLLKVWKVNHTTIK